MGHIAAASQLEPLGNYNVYDYFRMNSDKNGEYVAFQHKGMDHMKSELIHDIEAMSYYFKNTLGLGKGDVYTVFMPTSIESMIIFMALNKLGVIVNFVHPLLPPENVTEIMDFTKSKGIAVLDRLCRPYIPVISKQNVPVLLCLPAEYASPDKFAVKPDEEIIALIDASVKEYAVYNEIIKEYSGKTVDGIKDNGAALAVYMNGGGTTGKSKTIKLSNNALNNVVYMCCSINEPLEHPGYDTEIAAMPFFHAFGFCVGGLSGLYKSTKMVFLPQFDADAFVEIIKNNHVTEFNGVPNMFKKLLAHPEFDGPHLSSIEVLFSGGDDLRPAFLEEFRQVLHKNGSKAEIHQGYGLTECCAICTVNPKWENKIGSIGKPLPGNTIEIWDDNNKPLPIGEIGQIVISGPTMMEGYLTENGPVDDGIYKDENGKKWVLTGDLGYYDDEGFMYFVGRKKRVVIISGYNVYPKDIEKLLTELPFLNETCAVQGFDDDGKILVRLYAVLNPSCNGDKEEYNRQIINLCTEKLSKYSIPREIVYLSELPRTKLQKVDFMRLTQVDNAAPKYTG